MINITKSLLENLNSKPSKKINLKENKIQESVEGIRVKECKDDIDMINALEGDTLIIEDLNDWEEVKNLVASFAGSQGFYSSLYRDMNDVADEDLEFPIYM